MRIFLRHHRQAWMTTVRGLVRAPIATLLTSAVIAITLALPTGFYLAIDSVTQLTEGWHGAGRISLFLRAETGRKSTEPLVRRIQGMPAVDSVELVTPEKGLEEFSRYSGFGDALKALDHNPLPTVLVVQSKKDHQSSEQVASLVAEFKRMREVQEVVIDMDWVRRLQAWLALAQDSVRMISLGLGIAVLLIIGNTVRLSVLNRRDEIIVIKLVGGTDGYVRRPFLYTGAIQGLLGGIFAWLLVAGGSWWLSGPLSELLTLYGSAVNIEGMDWGQGVQLLGIGAALGWLGSLLAVTRHLRAIEPT